MSFMFNPFPYNDPNAVNRIENDGSVDLGRTASGNAQVAAVLSKEVRPGHVIAIDGYATVPFGAVIGLLPKTCEFISVTSIYKSAEELRTLFAEYLPEDREKDPVLLYGKIFKDGYEGIFDAAKLAALRETLKNKDGKCIVLYGNGALTESLRDLADVRIYVDVTPKKAVLNIKAGGYRNFGNDTDLPFKVTMRRCYYVDFELGFALRNRLMANGELDYYVASDDPANLKLIPNDVLHALVSRALDYPIRQRPVYLEGVWGGYFTMKERNLPKTMKNCAWVFDMIPMEVSTVIIMDGQEFEFPYYVVVAAEGKKLMGERCLKEFHGFFPIRFNYDDTFHSAGNMSIQLHPSADFVVPNHNELGRQDESYYIVATAQRARTYLGFNRGVDPEEFIEKVKQSEKDAKPVDYQKYIYSVESKPGIQVMIPAGTIHGSGKNQLILEIGSLTVGSYTYKMYDYLRKDLDGKPRPIHTYFGNINLNRGMMQDYVEKNLVNGGYRVIREEGDAKEVVVGECEQLYFSLRNLIFGNYMTDDTKGEFHVLALVDGEDVTVRSKKDPSRKFDMKFMDIVVVPADFGEYELINNKPETWTTIHKTLLK
ncbi:MAG: class I mannose-6-phosphate isomerase [Lachnospiraceae bacterium]|nr:class I mannose-6-phosphate isomerase [Lachnospiraceae bacterium]MBR5739530.1 class I mannose-6-phosphate isomerase [Lachnospiraceae bacterium]